MDDELEKKLAELGEVIEYGFDWDKFEIKIGKGFRNNFKTWEKLRMLCLDELKAYPIIEKMEMDIDHFHLIVKMSKEDSIALEKSLIGSNI